MHVAMPWIGLVSCEASFSKTLAREALANRVWVVLDPGTNFLPGSADAGVRGTVPRE